MRSDVTVTYGPDTTFHVVGNDVELCAKLTGEDLSRYLNKIESVGLR